jgi:hypothetical protein
VFVLRVNYNKFAETPMEVTLDGLPLAVATHICRRSKCLITYDQKIVYGITGTLVVNQ